MNILLSVILSALPIIAILTLMYNNGKVKKQPILLLAGLFIGGIVSWVLVRYVSNLFNTDIYKSQTEVSVLLGNIGFFLVSFGIIAVIEETSKFLIVNLFCIKNKRFTNPYDAIMYATCISLGFAFAENIMYLSSNGLAIAFSRAIFSIPVHACFGIFMGYYLGLCKMVRKRKMTNDFIKLFYLAIFIPFLFHGLYDYICNLNIKYINIVFIVYSMIMYVLAICLIIRLNGMELKRLNINNEVKERVYNPNPKNYKNIYYGLNDQKQEDLEQNNVNPNTNWRHAEGKQDVYQDNDINMSMFKNNE